MCIIYEHNRYHVNKIKYQAECGVLAKMFRNNDRLNTQVHLNNTLALPVVLYVSETRRSTQIKEQSLQTSETKSVRRIRRYTKANRIINATIWTEMNGLLSLD